MVSVVEKQAEDQFCQEAKFFDIPIPLNSFPLKQNLSQDAYAYYTYKDISELVSFYETEMEMFGWNKIGCFTGFEILLNFEKPNKYVSISIREHDNSSKRLDVYIFMINKTALS